MILHRKLTKSAIVILVSLAAALIFAKLTTDVAELELANFDSTIMQQVYAVRTPALTTTMNAVSALGSNGLIVLLILVGGYLWYRNYRHLAVLFVAGSVGGELMNIMLKVVIDRPRPLVSPLVIEPDSSFPSGHSMDSLIVYFLIVYCVFRLTTNVTWRVASIIIATLLVAAIGYSRVYLGVHYPSDVLGGYLAALWWLGTVWLIDHWYLRPALKA